ncbi:MAG: 50S ribosomal protein L21 [Bacteroidetes bacterium]|nr:MAG: 50S ribosomal protein L21 [Bacteroidota bacterium]
MYAIVDIAGQQFKVEEGKKIFVHRLDKKEGDKVDINEVLLIDQDGKVVVGQPIIKGASVTAKVIDHPRGDKVKIFKKKRRKGYQVLNGHRQNFTQIQIESILEKEAEKKTEAKKETVILPDKKPIVTASTKKTAEAKVEVKEAKKPVAKKAPASSAKSAEVKTTKKASTAKKAVAKKVPAKPAAAKSTKKEDK